MLDARHDRDLLAVAGDSSGAPLRRSGKKDLALRLTSDLQPVPRTLNDFDAGTRQPSVLVYESLAEREAKHFDRAAGVMSRRGVNERFQRLARQDRRRAAFDEGLGEITFEATGDRQIASVMAIAAPDHS